MHLHLNLIIIQKSLVHKRLVRKSSQYLYAQALCPSCGHQCWDYFTNLFSPLSLSSFVLSSVLLFSSPPPLLSLHVAGLAGSHTSGGCGELLLVSTSCTYSHFTALRVSEYFHRLFFFSILSPLNARLRGFCCDVTACLVVSCSGVWICVCRSLPGLLML